MSIDGAYDSDNIFAKILRGEMPCHKVYEDDAVMAFMDVFPQSLGHTLVLPKTEARNILDLPEDDLVELIKRVKKIAAGVRAALSPDGIAISQFTGAPAGQTIFHIHFHIVPRYEGEAAARHGEADRVTDAELAAQAQRIAAAIEG